MTTRRIAVAELYATLIILTIAVSMSYIVYSELRTAKSANVATFFNTASVIPGSPALLFLQVNSSVPTRLVSMAIDNVSSSSGVFELSAEGYGASPTPCSSGTISFFSVYTEVAAPLRVDSDGVAWIAGSWRDSGGIQPGWNEVMVRDASSCSTLLRGGTVSSLPLTAGNPATHFSLYIPESRGTHSLLLIFREGYDRVAFSA